MVCESYVPHKWKKDCCSICFESKLAHEETTVATTDTSTTKEAAQPTNTDTNAHKKKSTSKPSPTSVAAAAAAAVVEVSERKKPSSLTEINVPEEVAVSTSAAAPMLKEISPTTATNKDKATPTNRTITTTITNTTNNNEDQIVQAVKERQSIKMAGFEQAALERLGSTSAEQAKVSSHEAIACSKLAKDYSASVRQLTTKLSSAGMDQVGKMKAMIRKGAKDAEEAANTSMAAAMLSRKYAQTAQDTPYQSVAEEDARKATMASDEASIAAVEAAKIAAGIDQDAVESIPQLIYNHARDANFAAKACFAAEIQSRKNISAITNAKTLEEASSLYAAASSACDEMTRSCKAANEAANKCASLISSLQSSISPISHQSLLDAQTDVNNAAMFHSQAERVKDDCCQALQNAKILMQKKQQILEAASLLSTMQGMLDRAEKCRERAKSLAVTIMECQNWTQAKKCVDAVNDQMEIVDLMEDKLSQIMSKDLRDNSDVAAVAKNIETCVHYFKVAHAMILGGFHIWDERQDGGETVTSSLHENLVALSPQSRQALDTMVGVGVQLRHTPSGHLIESIVQGGAADDSRKIKIGDFIVAVNGTTVLAEKSIKSLIVGPPGSSVSLTIMPNNSATPFTIELIRQGIVH